MQGSFLSRARVSGRRGIVMPAVLFVSVFIIIFILLLANRLLRHSRLAVASVKSARGELQAQGGVQLGLARLSRRISFAAPRINDGVGGTFWPIEGDWQRYTSGEAGSFWTQMVSGFALADETEFSTPTPTMAQFMVDTPSNTVRVQIVYRDFVLHNSNYSDLTMRFGYDIHSTDKASGRIEHVSSYLSDTDSNIQIRVKRLPISRYNLFAISNRDILSGQPVYDSTSYTGPVYSEQTFYQKQAGGGGPFYSGQVEISTAADPTCLRPGNPCSWPGSAILPQPASVDVISMPGTQDESWQRGISYCGYDCPGNPPALADGIHSILHPESAVWEPIISNAGTVFISTVAVYIKGDAEVVMRHETLGSATTTYYDITVAGVPGQKVIYQNIGDNPDPQMLIYADGNIRVKGAVSTRAKVTVAASQNLVVIGSVTYNGGLPSPATVIGLVAWGAVSGGNVLIGKDIVTPPGTPIWLHAAVMAPNGGFGAEGYEDFDANYTGYRGQVNHVGSIVRRSAVPTLNASLTKGWGLASWYDGNLQSVKAPPYYPGNGRFQVPSSSTGAIKVVDIYRVH